MWLDWIQGRGRKYGIFYREGKMKEERVIEIMEGTFTSIRILIGNKGEEYAFGDRLSNFKSAGLRAGMTPEAALDGMRAKHEVSIIDFTKEIGKDRHKDMRLWEEKINDDITYLILLKCLLLDTRDKLPSADDIKEHCKILATGVK